MCEVKVHIVCTSQTEGFLQDLQRFHGLEHGGYLCDEIKEYSCRSKEGWWSTKPVMEVRILPGVPSGRLAQLVEHRSDMPKVTGSIPITSTQNHAVV